MSTADWDNPFWTNKQHVACELARLGYRVLYIESVGLRRPSASAADLKRIWRRLKRGLRPPAPVRPNLWVWSPLVVPLQRYAWVRTLNRWLIAAGWRGWSRWLGLRPRILWTYNPMTLQFVSLDAFDKTIYHCVDEVKAQPGMPVDEIARSETALVRAVDHCFVTAMNLLESRRALNASTFYFPNVAEFDHFATARSDVVQVPADIAALPGPRIGFIGALSGYKVDFAMIRQMAQDRPGWQFVLIGKIGEGDPWTDASLLSGLPNLHAVGPRDYQALPACLKGFDVAILPCTLNEYTRSMFPMKFFEYLAAGCPVVSTQLDALQAYRHVTYLADDAADFERGIEHALRGEGASLADRLAVASEQTYERRTLKMLDIAGIAP